MRLQSTLAAALLIAGSGLTAGAAEESAVSDVAAPTELTITDVEAGTGPAVEAGQTAVVHYTGWLYSPSAPDHKGEKFDSSRERNRPISVPVGRGMVIKGWDQGLVGMKVGGQRRLIIPPALGYGGRGSSSGRVPPNATLLFDLELVQIQ
jgi:FKBP-type peptidyl-prolyl cis-trans isomerase